MTHRHRWTSDHALVGGLKENPGVWGDGGGVVILEACRCGARRRKSTWDHLDNRRARNPKWVIEPRS